MGKKFGLEQWGFSTFAFISLVGCGASEQSKLDFTSLRAAATASSAPSPSTDPASPSRAPSPTASASPTAHPSVTEIQDIRVEASEFGPKISWSDVHADKMFHYEVKVLRKFTGKIEKFVSPVQSFTLENAVPRSRYVVSIRALEPFSSVQVNRGRSVEIDTTDFEKDLQLEPRAIKTGSENSITGKVRWVSPRSEAQGYKVSLESSEGDLKENCAGGSYIDPKSLRYNFVNLKPSTEYFVRLCSVFEIDDNKTFISSGVTSKFQTTASPATPPLTQVLLLSNDRGRSQDFGWDLYESENVTRLIQVWMPAGTKAKYADFTGFDRGFHFKGGKFPGEGGSCQVNLVSGCTLAIEFTVPRAESLALPTYYTDRVRLFYTVGAQTFQTPDFGLRGNYIVPPNLEIYPTLRFGSVLVGATRSTKLPLVGQGDRRMITNVSAISESPDFIVFAGTSNPEQTCERDHFATKQTFCNLSVTFKAMREGARQGRIKIRYHDGLKEREVFVTAMANGHYPVPERDLLIVYNQMSPESRDITQYYLTKRPGLGINFPNVLGIDPGENALYGGSGFVRMVPASELYAPNAYKDAILSIQMNSTDLHNRVIKPIYNWIREKPERAQIKYIVLMPGIPRRTAGGTPPDSQECKWLKDNSYASTQFRITSMLYENGIKGLETAPSSRSCPVGVRISQVDMGSVEATEAYIDKITSMSNQVVISARQQGKGGKTFHLFDEWWGWGDISPTQNGPAGERFSIPAQNPKASVHYVPGVRLITDPPLEDVLGFETFGWNSRDSNGNGGQGTIIPRQYPINGLFKFTGKSNWYAIKTFESHNGWIPSYQGDYYLWFSANSFGGSNYSNTPAGAVIHIEEPGASGVNSEFYFRCWEAGELFGDCAWESNNVPVGAVVGDPFVTR